MTAPLTTEGKRLARHSAQRARLASDRQDALARLLDERIGWMGLPFTPGQRRELRAWLMGKVWDEWPGSARAIMEATK